MAVSLYRSFRPSVFGDVVGQEHIIRTLTNQIKSGNISHAYIFTGTRGTGKTTTAKIFARAVNCLSPINGSPCGACAVCKSIADGMDILELDGASNNGVDEIRSLRDNSGFPPVNAKYKVYIIDEVHMLTINAFNALLKTLEEPPAHMIFILATTEIHKVPQTVLSRCMRFDFRLVPTDIIADRLCEVFDRLGVKYEKQAVYAIAKAGDGSVRDALSYADVALAYSDGNITRKSVAECLMVGTPDAYIPLAEAVLSGNLGAALCEIDGLLKNNSNINIVRRELCEFFKNLIFIKAAGGAGAKDLTDELMAAMRPLASAYDSKLLYRTLEIFVKLESDIRYSSNPRTLLEAAVVKAADFSGDLDASAMIIRIKNLESKLSGIESGIPIKTANGVSETDGQNRESNTQEKTQSPPKPPPPDGKPLDAGALVGRMIKTLRTRGHFQLFASLQNVFEAEINGSELTVFFTDEADFNSFCIESNKSAAQAVLDEFASDIRLKPALKKVAEQNAAEETERLKQIFDGAEIIVKW
ncbi:MAG: DNA polymerase III subunit gamma/tau [Clostridiales bacterium]|jgi:DNA polymerase-3 subunit gamma/tau|nr:DNA polymerase III subunit gamma/tau [Clostridiales bacterium]